MHRSPITRVVAVLFAFACLIGHVPVDAESGTGLVRVTVVDATTRAAISLARVYLLGTETQVGFTDRGGVAAFERIASGAYTVRIERAGYRAAEPTSFEVSDGRTVSVQVTLAQNGALTVIGSVKVRSAPSPSRGDLDASSPATRLSQGLGEALFSLPDVSDVAGGLSINGHDPSQTSYAVDGVAIPGLGSGGGIRGIDADLFGGATVSTSAQNGGLGGGVTLRTLEPTLAFQSQLDASYGPHDSSFGRVTARGTVGYVGFVATHAGRGTNGPLDGALFGDASGSAYRHSDGTFQAGDVLKLRAPVGKNQSLTATALSSHASADEICRRVSGPLPCGYGPGNADSLISRTDLVAYKASAGAFDLSLNGASFGQRRVNDGSRRVVNGRPDPLAFASTISGTSSSLRAVAPLSQRNLLSFSAFSFAARTAGSSTGHFPFSSAASVRYRNYELLDTLQATPEMSLSFALGSDDSKDGGNRYGRFDAALKGAHDTLQLHAESGRGGAGSATVAPALDPASLVYDCPGNAVFGSSIGDLSARRSSRETDLTWTHRANRFTTGASAYVQQVRGDTISTYVNGLDLAVNALPPGFLTAISQFYGTPAGCGRNASLSPSQLYLLESVRTDSTIFSGVRAAASGALGPALIGGLFVTFQRAAAFGEDRRLTNPLSVIASGQQLPNVPPVRAAAILDYRPKGSSLEALALATHTASNNGANLPAYTTLSAGLSYQTAHGTFTLGVQNLTNAYAGSFTSPANSVALPLVGGGVLPTLAQPLAPREARLTYTVRIGSSKQRQTVDVADSLADDGGSSGFKLQTLPDEPPAHPFSPALDDPRCTPEAVSQTRTVLDALNRASELAEHSKATNGSYPQSIDYTPPPAAQVDLRYVKTKQSYGFVVRFRGRSFKAVGRCAPVGFANAAAVQARDLPPLNANGVSGEFGFSPNVGFYYATTAKPVNQQSGTGKRRTLQDQAADPFALTTACPVQFRPLAEAVMAAVRSHAGADGPRTEAGPGIALQTKSAGFSRWTEVTFANLADAAVFAQCADVANAGAEDLRSRRYGNAVFPVINYAEPFGFYVVRQP